MSFFDTRGAMEIVRNIDVVEKLDNINKTLENNFSEHNKIAQKMLDTIQKPESPFFRVLAIVGTIVGILGFVHVIDTIIKWL